MVLGFPTKEDATIEALQESPILAEISPISSIDGNDVFTSPSYSLACYAHKSTRRLSELLFAILYVRGRLISSAHRKKAMKLQTEMGGLQAEVDRLRGKLKECVEKRDEERKRRIAAETELAKASKELKAERERRAALTRTSSSGNLQYISADVSGTVTSIPPRKSIFRKSTDSHGSGDSKLSSYMETLKEEEEFIPKGTLTTASVAKLSASTEDVALRRWSTGILPSPPVDASMEYTSSVSSSTLDASDCGTLVEAPIAPETRPIRKTGRLSSLSVGALRETIRKSMDVRRSEGQIMNAEQKTVSEKSGRGKLARFFFRKKSTQKLNTESTSIGVETALPTTRVEEGKGKQIRTDEATTSAKAEDAVTPTTVPNRHQILASRRSGNQGSSGSSGSSSANISSKRSKPLLPTPTSAPGAPSHRSLAPKRIKVLDDDLPLQIIRDRAIKKNRRRSLQEYGALGTANNVTIPIQQPRVTFTPMLVEHRRSSRQLSKKERRHSWGPVVPSYKREQLPGQGTVPIPALPSPPIPQRIRRAGGSGAGY